MRHIPVFASLCGASNSFDLDVSSNCGDGSVAVHSARAHVLPISTVTAAQLEPLAEVDFPILQRPKRAD